MDSNFEYGEIIASGVFGFIFGNKIEQFIGIIVLATIIIAGIFAMIQVLSNPTAITSNNAIFVNFGVFASKLITSLAFSGFGTFTGIIVRKLIRV